MTTRLVYAAGIVAWLATLVWAWIALPERVPSHWGSNGELPDAWSGRGEMLVTMAGVGAAVAAMPLLARLVRVGSGGLVNAPNARWWTATPARRARFERLVAGDLMLIGAATMVLLAVVFGASIVAAGDPEGRMPDAVPLCALVGSNERPRPRSLSPDQVARALAALS